MSHTRRKMLALFGMLGIAGVATSCPRNIGESTTMPAVPPSVPPPPKPRAPTPAEIEGPFYPVVAQADVDLDLTHVAGHAGRAAGTHLWIDGIVVDTLGQPIANVPIELWQANHHGRYNHPADDSDRPLDQDFQGWAIIRSDAAGTFRLRTVLSGIYPVNDRWSRPPHLHWRIGKAGFVELTTQTYFPDQPLNKLDLLLRRIPAELQPGLVARPRPADTDGLPRFGLEFVLAPV